MDDSNWEACSRSDAAFCRSLDASSSAEEESESDVEDDVIGFGDAMWNALIDVSKLQISRTAADRSGVDFIVNLSVVFVLPIRHRHRPSSGLGVSGRGGVYLFLNSLLCIYLI